MRIGGITINIESDMGDICPPAEFAYREFSSRKPTASDGTAHMNVVLEPENYPEQVEMDRIFDSGSSWSMFFDGENRFVSMKPVEFDQPIWMAKIGKDYNNIHVYCSDMLIKGGGSKKTISNPVCYPLDQILLMYFLSVRSGALVHAAGVEINGKGLVFPGKSGAGKSTLSHQLSVINGIKLLSDDRVIVKKEDGRFVAYGTPWPGEAGISANKKVPLRGLMFLKKGTESRIRRISNSEALKKLIPVTSIPWYDKPVLEQILDLCGMLTADISAYELEFTLDAGVADVIYGFMRETA